MRPLLLATVVLLLAGAALYANWEASKPAPIVCVREPTGPDCAGDIATRGSASR